MPVSKAINFIADFFLEINKTIFRLFFEAKEKKMVNQISDVREIRKYKLSQQRCHVMKRERKKRKEFRKLLRDEMTIRIFIAGNLINKRNMVQ